MVSEGNLKGADGRQLFLTEERDQWLRHAALAARVLGTQAFHSAESALSSYLRLNGLPQSR